MSRDFDCIRAAAPVVVVAVAGADWRPDLIELNTICTRMTNSVSSLVQAKLLIKKKYKLPSLAERDLQSSK